MEFNVGEVLLRHGEDVAGVGEIDVAALLVESHVLRLTFFEIL